jgi:hypothetical protein
MPQYGWSDSMPSASSSDLAAPESSAPNGVFGYVEPAPATGTGVVPPATIPASGGPLEASPESASTPEAAPIDASGPAEAAVVVPKRRRSPRPKAAAGPAEAGAFDGADTPSANGLHYDPAPDPAPALEATAATTEEAPPVPKRRPVRTRGTSRKSIGTVEQDEVAPAPVASDRNTDL